MKKQEQHVRSKKVNHMSFEELSSKLFKLVHHTHTLASGVTVNSPQDNSKYAQHLRGEIAVLNLGSK